MIKLEKTINNFPMSRLSFSLIISWPPEILFFPEISSIFNEILIQGVYQSTRRQYKAERKNKNPLLAQNSTN